MEQALWAGVPALAGVLVLAAGEWLLAAEPEDAVKDLAGEDFGDIIQLQKILFRNRKICERK